MFVFSFRFCSDFVLYILPICVGDFIRQNKKSSAPHWDRGRNVSQMASVLPPQFTGTSRQPASQRTCILFRCNGQTRRSLLSTVSGSSSKRYSSFPRHVLAPTGHSLKTFGNDYSFFSSPMLWSITHLQIVVKKFFRPKPPPALPQAVGHGRGQSGQNPPSAVRSAGTQCPG